MAQAVMSTVGEWLALVQAARMFGIGTTSFQRCSDAMGIRRRVLPHRTLYNRADSEKALAEMEVREAAELTAAQAAANGQLREARTQDMKKKARTATRR